MATSYIIPSNLWRTQNKNYYCKNGFDSDNYRSDKSQQHTCHENYSRSAPNLPLLFSCVYDHGHKVSDKARYGALDEGIVAQNDILLSYVCFVRLNDSCE